MIQNILKIPHQKERKLIEGVQVYSLEAGLAAVGADFYTRHPGDARTYLAMVKDSPDVLLKLLDGGKSVVAGRLSGAFRNIGYDKIANSILATMKSAGYDVRETEPFLEKMEHELSSLGNRSAIPMISKLFRCKELELLKIVPVLAPALLQNHVNQCNILHKMYFNLCWYKQIQICVNLWKTRLLTHNQE